jgi:LacI family repressor for deo operon, udp, cdd, tsx, nupC, and nupG
MTLPQKIDPACAARPKMEDIARIAGVSVSTVSRALAGSPKVTGDTRARIEAAVRETGYVVNQVAQGLRLQRSRQLLVLLPTIANPFFAEVVQGIEEEAAAAGYGVLVGSTENDPAREAALARQLLTGGVDGLVLLTGRIPAGLAEQAAAGQIVAVSETIPGSRLPTVAIDNEAAAAAAVAHLLALGHRRIAHIGGPPGNVLTTQRARGWRKALAEGGIEESPVFGDFTMASGEIAMAALLARTPRPSAVFCANDEMAIGAMKAARAAGLAVPRDLSLIGFDDISFAAFTDPPLTTIRQPRRELGRNAVAALLHGGRKRQPMVHELIVRASTAAAPCPM